MIKRGLLIGLTAQKRNGKDLMGDYLINKYNFVRLTFADKVKKIAQITYDFTDDQMDENKDKIDPYWNITPRDAFKEIGTFYRNKDPEFWIKVVKKQYEEITDKCVVITDVRYLNEAEFIRNHGGIIVRIVRPSIISSCEHSSEQELLSINEDIKIINDSTINDYYDKIDGIYKTLI